MKGPRAESNPYDATGLEWQTSSPPPTDNFRVPPIVTDEPYGYHPEGSAPHAPAAVHRHQIRDAR